MHHLTLATLEESTAPFTKIETQPWKKDKLKTLPAAAAEAVVTTRRKQVNPAKQCISSFKDFFRL